MEPRYYKTDKGTKVLIISRIANPRRVRNGRKFARGFYYAADGVEYVMTHRGTLAERDEKNRGER